MQVVNRKPRTHNYIHSLLSHDEISCIVQYIEEFRDYPYLTEYQLLNKIYDLVKYKKITKKQFRILITFYMED